LYRLEAAAQPAERPGQLDVGTYLIGGGLPTSRLLDGNDGLFDLLQGAAQTALLGAAENTAAQVLQRTSAPDGSSSRAGAAGLKCGRSVDIASEYVDKPWTTPSLRIALLALGVARRLTTLVRRPPTLRRGRRGAWQRSQNKRILFFR
jgi:hypothetical protein